MDQRRRVDLSASVGWALRASALALIALLLIAFDPPKAPAHEISRATCGEYQRMHAFVTGRRDRGVLAGKACRTQTVEHRYAHCDRLPTYQRRNVCVIKLVFGAHGDAAASVSWCESSWRTWAANGQYLGTFQMGSNERATYGHGPDARSQADAAHRYFIASGSDWSPWECRP